MQQLLQNLKTGETYLADVPVPTPAPGQVLVRVRASAVSSGTERMLADFAKKGFLGKARLRPDLFKQALNKAKREGFLPVWEAAQNKLEQPLPLGYSCAGVVEGLGMGVEGFAIGARVACAGAGYANHAEFVVVPENLCVLLPKEGAPGFEDAAHATLAAIALHGLRLGKPQVGETVAVIGLGLLGQLAAQIAKAAGCRVMGIDLDQTRVEKLREFGMEATLRPQAEAGAEAFCSGRGFDLVLIAADAKSNDPIELAGAIARDCGTVVAIGSVGMAVPRNLFYRKELVFKISRSYGPGRYDPMYEEAGFDYPYGYVRWTEKRNLDEVIRLMANGSLRVAPLITHRLPIEGGCRAYELISDRVQEPVLGIILTYGADAPVVRVVASSMQKVGNGQRGGVGILGAGNFATAVMLPLIRASGAQLRGIACPSGMKAKAAADKYGFAFSASSADEVLADAESRAVAIFTRHNLHAEQVCAALAAHKHVFVEKPLCMDAEELGKIEAARIGKPRLSICVGFNRRLAPYTLRIKESFVGVSSPKSILVRVNAGKVPAAHWTLAPAMGGGRLLGEGCHFIDWANHVVGAAPVFADCRAVGKRPGEQDWSLRLQYPDGSVADILYTSDGHPGLGKERYEVHASGISAVLDDFKSLVIHADKARSWRSWLRADKGHASLWNAFWETTEHGGVPVMAWDGIAATMKACFAARESLRQGCPVGV